MKRRADKAARLLCKLGHCQGTNQLIFFSTEKNVFLKQKVNKRNDQCICFDVRDVLMVMLIKWSATVIVLSIILSEGNVVQSSFFEEELWVNLDVYIHVMDKVAKRWMEVIAKNRHYIF